MDTKTRTKVDRAKFVSELTNAAKKGMSLSEFVASASQTYGWKPATLTQNYMKERKMLRSQLAVSEGEKKAEIERFLAAISLKDGRIGNTTPKKTKPVNKLSVYEQLLAPKEEPSHPIPVKEIKNLVSQIEGLLINASHTEVEEMAGV